MATRLILLEVLDVQTQDDLHLAIGRWNEDNPDREINVLQETSLIVGSR